MLAANINIREPAISNRPTIAKEEMQKSVIRYVACALVAAPRTCISGVRAEQLLPLVLAAVFELFRGFVLAHALEARLIAPLLDDGTCVGRSGILSSSAAAAALASSAVSVANTIGNFSAPHTRYLTASESYLTEWN